MSGKSTASRFLLTCQRPLRLAIVAASLATLTNTAFTQNAPAAATPTQLPRVAVPSHYAINLAPDADNLSFAGEAALTLTINVPTRELTLHAADLDFVSARIAAAGTAESIVGNITTDAAAQTVTVRFPNELPAGNYQLDFAYSGTINQQANGLFALDYTDGGGADKRALFTQFEAPDARRVVPSFDEPSYKATFDLSVRVPAGQMAVSNMPVKSSTPQGDGTSIVTFDTTPRMSTYLLFLGMGELERRTATVANTEVGVVTGIGNSGKAQFALDASVAILPWYNDYFGTAFPLPKLDNVAGPGQSQFFSAMENWGAIFTFERALLVDPASTSETTRRRVYEIVAHEMAHQWFGDLVTMAWWDDLWLNEGFASWMATKGTDVMHPEWEMLLTRVDGREAAMSLDAYKTTHSVVQRINTVDEVNQAFDAITYQKGEAIIAMLESFAGEDVWRSGIRAYMQQHEYNNTVTADLWNAVEAAGATGLRNIAERFTTQPGIPLVSVTAARCINGSTELTLQQGEFSRDAKSAKEQSPLRWPVPVRANVIGNAESRLVLDGSATLELAGCGPYVINSGQAGYFRSLYPADNIASLAADFAGLAAIDQRGLLADNWELGIGGYQTMSQALALVEAVPATASDAILASLPGYYAELYSMFDGDTAMQARLLEHTSRRLQPILDRIGYDERAGEGPQVPLLRQSLIQTLGSMGAPAVLTEARRRYAALAQNAAALDGPQKFVWFGIVAKFADQATWNDLRQRANAATTSLEKQQLFALLGRAADSGLAQQALDLALTDEPGKTTSAAIVTTVAGNHDRLAVDFVLAHREQYEALIDVSARSGALADLGGGSADPAMADTLEAYAAQFLATDSRQTTDRAIAAIRERAASYARLKPQVAAWLAR